jgi:hypothetical protein
VQHRNTEDNEITELATVDGLTYISVPDGVVLPEQPIALEVVALDDTLRSQIKAASPHSRLIGQRMIDTIRAAYGIDDEMYFARIGVGAANGLYVPTASEMEEMATFGAFVEGVREWGRSERAKLGL